jgi:bacteriorhodopsin
VNLWFIGVLCVGLSVVGAAMVLMATMSDSRLDEDQRRLLLVGGIVLIAIAAFAPMALLLLA